MLCKTDRHCSQRCIAMLEMLLFGLCECCLSYGLQAVMSAATACAEAMLFLDHCSKHMRQVCIADRHCFQLYIAMLETPCGLCVHACSACESLHALKLCCS